MRGKSILILVALMAFLPKAWGNAGDDKPNCVTREARVESAQGLLVTNVFVNATPRFARVRFPGGWDVDTREGEVIGKWRNGNEPEYILKLVRVRDDGVDLDGFDGCGQPVRISVPLSPPPARAGPGTQ